jgi:excisionase family DNA binding protein
MCQSSKHEETMSDRVKIVPVDNEWHEKWSLWQHNRVTPRFLTLSDVAAILNVAPAQVYTLVRSGELPAIKIGARGQWRVESQVVEDFITSMYAQTQDFVNSHPR